MTSIYHFLYNNNVLKEDELQWLTKIFCAGILSFQPGSVKP